MSPTQWSMDALDSGFCLEPEYCPRHRVSKPVPRPPRITPREGLYGPWRPDEVRFINLAYAEADAGVRLIKELRVAIAWLPRWALIRIYRCLRAAQLIHNRNTAILQRAENVRNILRDTPGYMRLDDL